MAARPMPVFLKPGLAPEEQGSRQSNVVDLRQVLEGRLQRQSDRQATTCQSGTLTATLTGLKPHLNPPVCLLRKIRLTRR